LRKHRGGDGLSQLLVPVLELIELPIEAAMREEFLVRTLLPELAFVHDKDGIG